MVWLIKNKGRNIWWNANKFLNLHNEIKSYDDTMNKRFYALLFSLVVSSVLVFAQQTAKSDLQQSAETELAAGRKINARAFYVKAYSDYASNGQMKQAVDCAVKATSLYYKDNLYKEAFDLLRGVDQYINTIKSASTMASLHYLTTKERMQMYMRLNKTASAKEQLNIMSNYAASSNDEEVKNDLLYNKAIYYYTIGQNGKGNELFKEMAAKLTATKEYDKVDNVYQTLMANARRSNNAGMVAQSYSSYMAWKDSVYALKKADEIAALKKKIADDEAAIEEKDSSLTTRQIIIVGLGVLLVALAAALVVGAIVLMRYMYRNRKQKQTINDLNDNNALKAGFISNISAQLKPTLKKLDGNIPEVKALLDFSEHAQMLSELESNFDDVVELEDIQIPKFCQGLMDKIRNKVKSNVTLTVNAPALSAKINEEYVSHILLHLLENAAEYTPAEGKIWLEYKKLSVHKHQFQVSDSGPGIPEEKRDNIFKAFSEIKDLTTGDGLGLPICYQMAQKMKGELSIDPTYTKGTRFVLTMQV